MTAAHITASLGDLLRRYKTRERIRTPELAERLGVSKSAADRLVQDRLADISLPLAERVATLLEVELTDVSAAYRVSLELMREEVVPEAR